MRRVWTAALAVGWLAALVLGPGAPAARADQPTAVAPTGPVVLIGVPDLQWQDVTEAGTPALWQLAGRSSIGAMTDQSGEGDARRAAGWMTLNTGSRAVAFINPPRALPEPSDPAQLARLVDLNQAARFRAQVGALGDALHAAGRKVGAVYGSGAVLGGMTSAGTVDIRASSVPDALQQGADVVVVEFPQLYDVDREDPARVQAALATIDDAVGTIEHQLPARSSLLVAGVSDGAEEQAHLHVAMAEGPRFGPGRLTSSSTGRQGVVQLIDVAATVLSLQGAAIPDAIIGQSWQSVDEPRTPTATEIARLIDLDDRSIAQVDSQNTYYRWLAWLGIAFALGTLASWARLRRGPPLLVSASVAAVPAASWLIQLVPWWRFGTWSMAPLTFGFAVLIGAIAVLSPWPRDRRWRIAGVVGGISAAVIVIDAATHSPLSLDAPFGDNPIIAGRFHGIGNVALAVLGAGTLLFAAALAAGWRAAPGAGRSGARAAAVVCAAGAVAVVVDGYPGLGDDFGGVLALLPAVAVLALVVSGLRVSWRWVAGILLVTLATVTVFALVDYLRPASQRTHLGRFVQQVADGSAWPVVWRKLGSSAATFVHSWPRWIVLTWIVLAVLVVLARRRGRLQVAEGVDQRVLGGLVAALAVLGFLGAALNDSGLAIPAFVFFLGGPLLVPLFEPPPVLEEKAPAAPVPDDERRLLTTRRE